MKQNEKVIRATSYVAGITAIAAAMLMAFFLVMSLVGLIHPRKQPIVLSTPSVSKIYDGQVQSGSAVILQSGWLLPGHELQTLSTMEYTQVGTYVDQPLYVIRDETGADVTKHYDITEQFGQVDIQPRMIQLFNRNQSKIYDGKPLTADRPDLIAGTLAAGHVLEVFPGVSITEPGKVTAEVTYLIRDKEGRDVTQQYNVVEQFGTLEIRPLDLIISTGSANKRYDGKPLFPPGWQCIGGTLWEGHILNVDVTGQLTEVGQAPSEATAWVTDEKGRDVSYLYNIRYELGTLQVDALELHIRTQSAQKEYDGEPLQGMEWTLTGGTLMPGDKLQLRDHTSITVAGSAENRLELAVIAADGTDVTDCYQLVYDYGTLQIQPRTICIRTASAQKKYDGTALNSNDFEITSGSLVDGDSIWLSCTSITEVGYSDNYVIDCVVRHTGSDGTSEDVTGCYRIVYDYGTLRITAR